MSNNTWFDELMAEAHAHKDDHRVLPFHPQQAVRVTRQREVLPDVYVRPLGEQCDVRYVLPHLRGSGGIVDAPVPSCEDSDDEVVFDRWLVSDELPN